MGSGVDIRTSHTIANALNNRLEKSLDRLELKVKNVEGQKEQNKMFQGGYTEVKGKWKNRFEERTGNRRG